MSIFVVLHGQYFSVISAEGGVVITSWKRLGTLRQVPLKVKKLLCSVQILKSRQLSISVGQAKSIITVTLVSKEWAYLRTGSVKATRAGVRLIHASFRSWGPYRTS